MEEEKEGKKKRSKFKKGCLGCLGCLGVGIGIILIVFIFLTILTGSTFISPSIYGRVYDKETKKPIKYVLVRVGYGFLPIKGSSGLSTLTNEKGRYFLKRKIFFGWPLKATELLIPELNERESAYFGVWFPGYKKYEIRTGGRKLLKGRLDIYLERPKTAEEAVEGLINNRSEWWYSFFPTTDKGKIYDEAGEKECVRIIKTYPCTKWADEMFWYLVNSEGYSKTNGINPERLNEISCEYLFSKRQKEYCFQAKKGLNE